MSKTEPYDQYAEECRRLASKTRNPEDKKRLEELADAWRPSPNNGQRTRKAT